MSWKTVFTGRIEIGDPIGSPVERFQNLSPLE